MQKIQIQAERDEANKVTKVQLEGSLDLTNFSKIKEFFEGLTEKEKNLRCVVDISKVMFIASSIWAIFIARSRVTRLSGGKMVLCNMPNEIKGVYKSMNIDSILPCEENYDQCISTLRSAN